MAISGAFVFHKHILFQNVFYPIKFSKRVESTVGKGEIARYQQFLLFPWCFQKTCTADTNQGLLGKGLRYYKDSSNFYYTILTVINPMENNVGEGENACNQHFLLFTQYF